MPVDRTGRFDSLAEPLKKVNHALVELNKICAGTAGAGGFDEAMIWGSSAKDDITAYMHTRTVLPDLADTVNKLLGGLPGGSGVSSAIDAAIAGVQKVITKIQSTAGDLTSDRGAAFSRLNAVHSSNPGYNYAPPVSEPFGFIPGIAGLISEASDGTVDLDKILGPIKALADLTASALGMADFTAFAVGTVELVKKTLTVSP